LTLAVSLDLVEKAGSWFKYEGENIAQGELQTVEYLRENESVFNSLRDSVVKMTGLEEAYELHSNPGPKRINEAVSE
jgi:recombination protein RecA